MFKRIFKCFQDLLKIKIKMFFDFWLACSARIKDAVSLPFFYMGEIGAINLAINTIFLFKKVQNCS